MAGFSKSIAKINDLQSASDDAETLIPSSAPSLFSKAIRLAIAEVSRPIEAPLVTLDKSRSSLLSNLE